MTAITSAQLITGLQIAALVMVLILLYHSLFIAVNLRKILRRVDDVSKEVEAVILKPISMADSILQWILDMIEKTGKKHHKKHSEHHHEKLSE